MGRALSNPKYLAFKEKCNLSRKLKPCTDKVNSSCAGVGRMFKGLNDWAENNRVMNWLFKIKDRNTTLTTELRAGTTTFLTLAYILSVNPNIIADTGGTCTVDDCVNPSPFCIFNSPYPPYTADPGYVECITSFKRSITSGTALGSCIVCLLMGFLGNLPIALAPAYFAYTVVGYRGTGPVPYKTALAAVFIEGFIFILLSITGIRGKLITYVPKSIMLSTSAGIGLFLAFIGLQAGEGIGLVTYDQATLVHIGGCAPQYRLHQFTPKIINGVCLHDNCVCNDVNMDILAQTGGVCPNAGQGLINSTTTYEDCFLNLGPPSPTGISGGILIAILMKLNVRGAILWGVLFAAIVAWCGFYLNRSTRGQNTLGSLMKHNRQLDAHHRIPGHSASYIGAGSPVPGGAIRQEEIQQVVAVPQFTGTLFQFDFSGFDTGALWIALITFLYVDFLDATGTMYSMAQFVAVYVPGLLNEETKMFERQLQAFCVDGVGAIVGACLGMSPIVAYIESASGIRDGGRTGLTTIATGFWFFVALWFTPVLSNVATYATAPALILVGSLMMTNVAKIDWRNPQKAIPAFLTIILMPLLYSIAYGVIGGLMAYIIMGVCTFPFYFFFPDWFEDRTSWKTEGEIHHDGALAFEGPREFAEDDKAYPTPKPLGLGADPAEASGSHSGSGSEHGSPIGKPGITADVKDADIKNADLATKASELSQL